MKTLFSRSPIRLLLAVLCLLPAVAPAQYIFTTNNGAITLNSYTGAGGVVVIPAATNGLPVTTLAAEAFENTPGYYVTSVTIPSSVTNLGTSAFQGCQNLTNAVIPASVSVWGAGAFSYCSKLASVTLGQGLTSIGTNAFAACNTLGSITIPNSVTTIASGAFQGCGLTNIFLSGGIKNIGQQAFYLCYSLQSVYFYGNAPSLDANVYLSAGNLTNYYRSFTTGWGSTLGGKPTALWQAPLPAAGITTYSNRPVVILPFQTGTIGTNFVVQMTTNLITGPWVTVTNGVAFVGVQVTNAPGTAFFRLQ